MGRLELECRRLAVQTRNEEYWFEGLGKDDRTPQISRKLIDTAIEIEQSLIDEVTRVVGRFYLQLDA